MKKFRTLVLSALIGATVCGSFAACGGPKKDVLYVLSFKPEYNAIFEEVNKIFLKENSAVKSVDYKAVDTNNYNTVFSSRVQSKYLDVFTSEVTYMMQGTNAYMHPLEKQTYMDGIKSEYLTKGSFYDPSKGGEPELLTLSLEQVACVVYYDKDLFAEYGVEVPDTWSEFISVLDTFKEAAEYPVVKDGVALTPIEAPIIFGGKSEWPTMTILNSVVADVVEINQPEFFTSIKDYDTNENIRFNNATWQETFEKVKKIGDYTDGKIWGLDYSFASTYFSIGNPTTNKKYPMMIDGTWVYSQITADFNVGAFALPAVEDPTNAEGKKNLAVKTGTTLSVFNGSNKKTLAEKYLEIFFRDDIYTKFVNFTKTPSVKSTVTQSDELVNSIFDTSKYTFVEAYDSRMPRYFPLPSASEIASLMKGNLTAKTVADGLQQRVELNKKDWEKYTQLAHVK